LLGLVSILGAWFAWMLVLAAPARGQEGRKTASPSPAASPSSTGTVGHASGYAFAAIALALAAVAASGIDARRRRLRKQRFARSGAVDSQTVSNKRQDLLQSLTAQLPNLCHSRLEARHLMSNRVQTVELGTPVERLQAMMQEKHIRHLLVIDDDGRLVGIVSERDVIGKTGATARSIMTPQPVTLHPDSQIGPAVTMMVQKKISCLPVVKHDRPCGIITTTDLLVTLQCTLQLFEKWMLATEGKLSVENSGFASVKAPSPSLSN
jgi:CBS domain-containing protein